MNLAILLVTQCFFLGTVFGAVKLGSYNVDRSQMTVSGISSGAAMATQFHFAHSSEISGCGVFAGVPYMCANGGGISFATACMTAPLGINVAALIAEVSGLTSTGQIDGTANIAGDKVYIWHGQSDNTVRPGSADNIEQMYNHYGANVKTETSFNAEHGQPTDSYGAACGATSSSFEYMNNCNYKGAFEMLNHMYGGSLTRPSGSVALNGQFYEFDQGEFFYVSLPSFASMDNTGYVYVPSGCVDKSTPCRFHIAFHGCQQNRGKIGDIYATKSGYLEAAELNNIIVLFPQTIATLPNPNACWDWWGYVSILYPTKEGHQILAVQRMLNRVASN